MAQNIDGENPDYPGGFPFGLSLFEFINNVHPQVGYERVLIDLTGPDTWRVVVDTDFDDPAHASVYYSDVWNYKN